ncbi:CAP domain-containing protein [Arachnia propionica]|uniref:CAP domain-containing protein n=1 Tax=Arachnia propionica TaxID=1750 RepID=A0A3P1WZ49_9ACTN|nr:CAP domain-containing protein [Arachnia propionica]RRD50947.1 CAP domain-containing protein [Arachnia propionica]
MRFIHLAAAVALLVSAGATTTHAAPPMTAPAVLPMEGNTTESWARTILDKVNELRSSQGLSPVTRYQELDAVAVDWSQQMAARATLEHRPNFSSHYPAGFTYAAENVAMHGGSGDMGTKMFELWRDSPGHYANMVNPEINSIGIGLAFDSVNNAWYATQNFAAYSASDAGALTRVGSEAPRPTPTPEEPPSESPSPSSPAPEPSRSREESTPPPSDPVTPRSASPSASPSRTQQADPDDGGEPAPSESVTTPVAVPQELSEDSQPSAPAPAPTPEPEPTAAESSLVKDPVPPVAVAEFEDSPTPWAWIVIGTVVAGGAIAGLVLLTRRLF